MEPDAAAGGSAILDRFFGSDAMRALFEERALVQSWLDVEAALARAQASLGLIPEAAAVAIGEAARVDGLDLPDLGAQIARSGHPLVPLVRALTRAAGEAAGAWVHFGATTQDVMDTGYVLRMGEGLELIDNRLARLARILRDLAIEHRTTPMAGRTHGQHALPTTFGLRAAGWYEEVTRHAARLAEMRPRLLVGSFGGAAGTMAGYGPRALELRAAMMRELGLGEPGASWHANQDRIAECFGLFGLIASTTEKLAREVYFLGRTEIGEVFESQAEGQVGSSTMPQKRNPIRSEAVVAASQMVRAQVPAALAATVAQDDRDMGPGMVFWKLVPDAFVAMDGALERLVAVFDGLGVDPAAMARNLESTGGRISSEAVMLRLTEWIDRHAAHAVVSEAVRASAETETPFLDCLAGHDAIAGRLSRAELAALLRPDAYLGAAAELVDLIVGEGRP